MFSLQHSPEAASSKRPPWPSEEQVPSLLLPLFFFFFNLHLKVCSYLYLERGREQERKTPTT